MREYVSEPLIDVFDPRHNARQIAKELTLLEDHLRHPPQHCPDCVRKHILKAEAYADEAISLDTDGRLSRDFDDAGAQLRQLSRRYGSVNKHSVESRRDMAQQARAIRKKMGKLGFASQPTKPKARRVTSLDPRRPPTARRVTFGYVSSLSQMGTPGWADWPGFTPGGPLDFTGPYGEGRQVITFAGPDSDDALGPPEPLQLMLGQMIGPGDQANFPQCAEFNATKDYEIPALVAPDPGGGSYQVSFVAKGFDAFNEPQITDSGCIGPIGEGSPHVNVGETAYKVCNCNVVLPRYTLVRPSTMDQYQWDPSAATWAIAGKSFHYHNPEGDVLTRMPAEDAFDSGGGHSHMWGIVDAVVANKLPSISQLYGWSASRTGRQSKDFYFAMRFAKSLVTIAASTSLMDPGYDGYVNSYTGYGTPGRVGLIPMPESLYPTSNNALYDPKTDPIINVLLCMYECTRDHESASSPYQMYIKPLVQREMRQRRNDNHEWTYAIARALGYDEDAARRFQHNSLYFWGASSAIETLPPESGGGIPHLFYIGGRWQTGDALSRTVDDIYRNPAREDERGDIVQTNAMWGAKRTIDQNRNALPPLVMRDVNRSPYNPSRPAGFDGTPQPDEDCTPDVCDIGLLSLYRGYPTDIPMERTTPLPGTRREAFWPIQQSPDVQVIAEENYDAYMTLARYLRDERAYSRAWMYAVILNDPCKEATALRGLIRNGPGTDGAKAAQVRLSEIDPELVRLCPTEERFPWGVFVGAAAGFGLLTAFQRRKEK